MANIDDLIKTIQSRAVELHERSSALDDLDSIFENAVHKTMEEIHRSKDNSAFSELVIINFILMGDKKGYSVDQLKNFLQMLRQDDTDDD